MSKRAPRVQDRPGFMLHATAWRETSLIVQTFRAIMAVWPWSPRAPVFGAAPVLSAFQPLLLSWTGNGEVKTLTRAEIMGIRPLGGTALMSAWYMNELLLRLLPREDAHPLLYDAYDMALQQLSGGTRAAARCAALSGPCCARPATAWTRLRPISTTLPSSPACGATCASAWPRSWRAAAVHAPRAARPAAHLKPAAPWGSRSSRWRPSARSTKPKA